MFRLIWMNSYFICNLYRLSDLTWFIIISITYKERQNGLEVYELVFKDIESVGRWSVLIKQTVVSWDKTCFH